MSGYPTCAVRRWDPFIGFSYHNAVIPPVPAPFPQWPHLSLGIVSGTQLFSQPSNGGDKDILCDGVHLMGRLSDAFPVVPHITFGVGYQPMLPMTILFGSSMSCWGSGKVTLYTGNPIFGSAEADIATYLGFVLAPHLACNETYSLPYDVAVGTNTTCQVGFSAGDFTACLIDIAIALATEVVAKGIGDALGALTRKIKVARAGSSKLAKARAIAKQADELATVADNLDSAAAQLDELSDFGKIGDNAYRDMSEEAAYQLKNADADAAKALKAKTKAAAEAQSALKKVSDLESALPTQKANVDKLVEQQALYDDQYAKGLIDYDTYKASRASGDAQLAKAKKQYQKSVDTLADMGDDSFAAIWQRVKTKSAATSEEVTTSRSKYMSFTDYVKTYGTPSGGVLSDWKTYASAGLYPAYQIVKSSGEYLQTWAHHSGHRYLYAASFKALKGTSKLSSRVMRELSSNWSSEDKSVAWFSGYGGYYRLDLIEDIDGLTNAWIATSSGWTGRFDWVGDNVMSAVAAADKFGWADPSVSIGEDARWADKTFAPTTGDRFGWVPVDDEDES